MTDKEKEQFIKTAAALFWNNTMLGDFEDALEGATEAEYKGAIITLICKAAQKVHEHTAEKGEQEGDSAIDIKSANFDIQAYKKALEKIGIEQIFAANTKAQELIKLIKAVPRKLTQIQAKKLPFPLDKPNSELWELQEEGNGQLCFKMDNKNENAVILYSIDFDNLDADTHITKRLTARDKLYYSVIASLFNAGNQIISISQICKTLNNGRNPKAEEIAQVNESITKMAAAHIFIDNLGEVEAKKSKTLYKYDASLLPCERLSAFFDGGFTDCAIHLFREPPLISFARERKQITTINMNVLQAPVSRTEQTLRIQDYLIERISHMKRKKSSNRKMSFETIFKKCTISTKQGRQRAKGYIRRYLDHYKKVAFIKDYGEEKDGITIILADKKELSKNG